MNLSLTLPSALVLFVRGAICLQFASLVYANSTPALYTGTVNIGSVNGGGFSSSNSQNVGGQNNQSPVQIPAQVVDEVSGQVASQVPAPAQNQNLGDVNGQTVGLMPSQTNSQPFSQPVATPTPAQAGDQVAHVASQNIDEPIITSLESLDGPAFLANVMRVTKPYRHNEMIAAYSTAAMLPVSPTVDYAVVCFQRTRKGVFKVNSRNPAFQGMMRSQADLDAYFQLFKLNKGSTFNYNIPMNADGSGNVYTFYGQVFLKHGDGLANGDTICFARYK